MPSDIPVPETPETDAMRDMALTLNDTRLNREPVSVNQIREILRHVGYAAAPSSVPPTPETDVWYEAKLRPDTANAEISALRAEVSRLRSSLKEAQQMNEAMGIRMMQGR